MSLLLGLGALVVVWAGSREVIQGRITLGQFVAFNAYLTLLSWPMIAFGWVTNMLQRGMASWKRMLEVLETEPAIRDLASRADLSGPPNGGAESPALQVASGFSRTAGIRGEIEFRDLTFAYSGTPVLSHISVRIEAGQTVAL